MQLGRHAILDGRGVSPDLLNDPERLTSLMREALARSGATVLSVHHHRFDPQGATVVLILAESHASIHTYPEHGEYMADIFTCGKVRPDEAAELLARMLGGEHRLKIIGRGLDEKNLSDPLDFSQDLA